MLDYAALKVNELHARFDVLLDCSGQTPYPLEDIRAAHAAVAARQARAADRPASNAYTRAMTDHPSAREKLLAAAERLFSEHGFAAVKLRDLEQAAGVHHATFYHHAPGGKVQLFVEAVERLNARHEAALNARVREHYGDLRAQLRSAADWLLANPVGNHTRLLSTDLAALPEDVGQRLARQAYAGVVGPLADALRDARAQGHAELEDDFAEVVAGGLLAALQALQAAHARYPGPLSAQQQAHRLIDVLLHGLTPRKDQARKPPEARER